MFSGTALDERPTESQVDQPSADRVAGGDLDATARLSGIHGSDRFTTKPQDPS